LIGNASTRAKREAAAIALARALMAETREELARADSKASTLLAGAMVAVGVVWSALAAGQWSPLRVRPAAALLWWPAVVCALAGLGCLVAIIYPAGGRASRRTSGRHMLGYFGHIQAHPAGELQEALRARAALPELERLAHELAAVSAIAGRKYRLMRCAIWAFSAGATLALAGGVVSWVVR
jgi:hypothetical protein